MLRTCSRAITWSCLDNKSYNTSILGNRQATRWMIESKLFFGSVQQLLEQRLLQIRHWNHKPLLLALSHIHSKKPSRNIPERLAESPLSVGKNCDRQTNTHYSISRKEGVSFMSEQFMLMDSSPLVYVSIMMLPLSR